MTLGKTEQNTLRLLKTALSDIPPEVSIDSWQAVKQELADQAVLTLPIDALIAAAQTPAEKQECSRIVAENLRTFHNIMLEQEELNTVLADVPFVVLKGASAAMYYPIPEYRQMGDIDIIVAPKDFDRAVVMLDRRGYERTNGLERHIGFRTSEGIEIELHRLFASGMNDEQNAILDQLIYSAIEKREFVDVCGYSVPVLPTLGNGLVLLAHINQHLSSGLGLRQIVDWMMYVEKCLPDDCWNASFGSLSDAIGMKTLAETTTLLCKRYLGLNGVTWCDNADEALADELLAYLFDKGNFGRKQEFYSNKTVEVMHSLNNPKQFFDYLVAGGMLHWEAARKYRILKPLAPFYQIGHLVRKGLSRKTSLSALGMELKQSQREADFLDRLGVTRK